MPKFKTKINLENAKKGILRMLHARQYQNILVSPPPSFSSSFSSSSFSSFSSSSSSSSDSTTTSVNSSIIKNTSTTTDTDIKEKVEYCPIWYTFEETVEKKKGCVVYVKPKTMLQVVIGESQSQWSHIILVYERDWVKKIQDLQNKTQEVSNTSENIFTIVKQFEWFSVPSVCTELDQNILIKSNQCSIQETVACKTKSSSFMSLKIDNFPYKEDIRHLPKISVLDPQAIYYNVKPDQVLKILRDDESNGKDPYYRLCIAKPSDT